MIYVIKHRPVNTPTLEGYEDLNVGTNETLSAFNPYINETTGLYEIWKRPDKLKGLVHYRRFFMDNGDYLTVKRADEILKHYDVITTVDFEAVPLKLLNHNLDEWIVKKYVSQLPEEVIKWFEAFQQYNICNMFVSRREFIDTYCEWLFPIIIPLCHQFIREDITSDPKRNRTIGFITECLFGYYCSSFNRYNMEVKIL